MHGESDEPSRRLRDNIREELQAQNALQELGLHDSALDLLADALVANIDYAFRVEWSPKWDGTRGEEGRAQ